jgi:hypothetical protein
LLPGKMLWDWLYPEGTVYDALHRTFLLRVLFGNWLIWTLAFAQIVIAREPLPHGPRNADATRAKSGSEP